MLTGRALGRVVCAQWQTEGESQWQNSPVTAWIYVEVVYWQISMCLGRLYLSSHSGESLCSLNFVSGVICRPCFGLTAFPLPTSISLLFHIVSLNCCRVPFITQDFPSFHTARGSCSLSQRSKRRARRSLLDVERCTWCMSPACQLEMGIKKISHIKAPSFEEPCIGCNF